MVRETRYLLVGNLPEKTSEDAVAEHFKRYGKIQSVKIHQRENEEVSSAIVAFGDIKSASKAHGAENRIEGNLLSTEYSEGSATGSAVTRTVEPRIGSYNRSFSRSKGSEDGESFETYYGNSRYSASYGDEMYSRGRPRERFAGRGTFKAYDNRGGFHGRAKTVDQTSQDEFEKPKLHHSPAHSTSHSGSRHSSKNKKKRVSRSGSHTSSSSSSSGSTSSCASRSSSRSSSRCSTTRSHALPPTTTLVKSYRTESQESNNSDKTGANDDDKRPRGICINHLPLRSTDTSLRDGLFHEYKKYGKVNAVLVAGVGDERYAIVSFRKPEDAAKALSASHDKVFFGSKIKVAQHEGIEVDDNEFRPPEAELDEHHPKATRTLFVGNLEKDISNQELRERFLKFGEILDIDVKRQGAVSAYAFVQFTDIRSVVKVLKEMEGEVWGSMKLKLGFGKSMPTNCVWLDNVDQTVQENFLSRQFGRYGQVTHGIIDRIKGKGLVYFTNAEQAQYALVEMRNRILNNKKIMIDFASRDCQVEFYEQMEKNGQLKPGLRPDERRGWLYNRQTPEGQWEASYDNRTANFVKFSSPGNFRGPQRGSRVAGRGAGRYKEEFSEEFKRTRSYEDYRYPGESDDFEQDLRAYQRERQHGSQSPPPYGEDVYADPAYQRSKEFYKYAESYRSGSPHSERTYEGFEYDKMRVDEKYYGKERYIVRERSPEVQFNRSWSRSPTHGGQMSAKEAVGRNTPPTPMDDEARDFSRDVSPVEEGQSKYGDSKSKRRSEDDFNICEADIAELKGRSKYTGVFHKEAPSWPEDKYERKRSYEESFSQDYMKSPRKQNRLFSSKSSLDRIESSKRDLYQKYQIIQSRITEKLKGRNESSPSSASSGSEPGQLNEGELSKLQHEKASLLEKLKQLDKESSTSDIEEAFDMEDPRKIPSKRARLEPMGSWGEPPPQPQSELGNMSNKYDYRGMDSTIVRKQPDSIHNFDEKERSKSCTRSSVDESDHEEFTSLLSPKDAHIGFIKKRKKSEHSEENNRSFRSKHGEEDPHVGSDNDEFRNISRLDQLSSNPVFRRLSSNDSSTRASYYPHESYSELHRHNDTEMASGEGVSTSHSEENKHHKRSDSTNKSHSHRSKHRHKEDHQPTKIPLEEDFSNAENVDPRNPHRIRQSLSLPLPKFARLDANVMTSPDVNDSSPVISKTESPRFSSPSSGSKNTSSPQRSPSESNSTNSQENPQQDYIPEENPSSDVNNDAAPMEVLGEKGEFDSDGSSEHSDHNDSFEMDKISLEERIRRLDEKLNAVPVPKSSTKLASEITSLPTNSTVVSKSDTLVSSLSRTALYSKFKINKKEVTPGTGADVKTGESTEIARKVTSRFSIIDQDTKRLQDKINENSSPKSTPSFDENLVNSSPMTPLRTKGAVKEMPAQMPLATLPGSLAGRLGNGAASFPTLTATTTSSNSSRPEETKAVDVFSVNPAVVSGGHERQWQLESSSLKTSIKPWQMESSSLSKNSSPDQISGKEIGTGHLAEDNAYKPLITPAFRKQMSDTFSKTEDRSSPKHSPLEQGKSPSPSLENKTSVFDSPKSEVNLLDSAGQKSNSSDPAQADSSTTGKEISRNIESKSGELSQESKMDVSQEEQTVKSDVGSSEVPVPMEFEESNNVDKKNNEALKPKSSPPVVLTKAEVKDMSPINLLNKVSGSKDKSSTGTKDSHKKHSHDSSEDSNSSVVSGKRKADTDDVNKSETEKSKDSTTDHKSVSNTSDSESLDTEKAVQAKKPKIHKSESQNSDMLSEKMEKSSSNAKAKDSQKKDKNKDSKKKEKCEGDSTKKDKNHHERKDKDKDGGKDKGTSSSSSKSLSVSSSSTNKSESEKNNKTEDKKAKSSKSEERKSEKSSKTVGSSKSSEDKSKSSESIEKNSKTTSEKKVSSSENKKDAEKAKKASDHAGHRKESKSSTSSKPSSEKSKDKSKDKTNVKSKESVKSEKSAKDGMNDKSSSKTKVEEKAVEKSSKTEHSNAEKNKEVSEEKQKNAVTNENNAKGSKSMDTESKGNGSQNSESSEKSKEKSNSLELGSSSGASNDHLKDSKTKAKHSSNEKSVKPKQKDETRTKTKEKHSSEKSKDKTSKESKTSSKKEESKSESSKDNTEKKTESKSEPMESKAKHDTNDKSDDKKLENSDKKVSPKDGHSDSKKKLHESSKPLDKMHKPHKKKSSSSSVSDDVTSNESSKHSKSSAEKSKPSKTEHKSKNDSDKTMKKEIKGSKSEEDKKKPSKLTTEKKKSSKENRPNKTVTPKKKEKKEEKIEEHKSSEVAKKADDDFDWDAWKEESMYDKVKRRSTYKDKEREMEQNRQKQLDQLQERRQKKSKSGSILQSDVSSNNYSDSDDTEPSKKTFNRRKSKSKKIYSSSDTDSDFRSSIFPPEKKLQPQKPKPDPSKKSKKQSLLGDIYSSDSDESTDSSFSTIPETKKKVKQVKKVASFESDDTIQSKSKKGSKKVQENCKPRSSPKQSSLKKQNIFSIYSSSDDSDDSDSDLDFSKKFSRAKENNIQSFERKSISQKSAGRIYSSSDSDSAEESSVIPVPKPISLSNKTPKTKTKEKQRNSEANSKKIRANDSNFIEEKSTAANDTSKSTVISQTILEKEVCLDSVLDSVEKTDKNKKDKLTKKNKKKEKENILVGEGKLEIGKNHQFGLFEKIETMITQSNAKGKKVSVESKADDGKKLKENTEHEKQKESKKKKSDSMKEREPMKKPPELISPVLSPVTEFSDSINFDSGKNYDGGSVIVDEIPIEEDSLLMDAPCGAENDNARGMWDTVDEREKLSKSLAIVDGELSSPEKSSMDSDVARDPSLKKSKKKKVDKEGEAAKKTKKVAKLDKDGGKAKKKKNKSKNCSEVDKTIDDVSKGKDILQMDSDERNNPEFKKADGMVTDFSDVDLDFSTPLFGNFVPEKIKPNRPSAKDKSENEFGEGEMSDDRVKEDAQSDTTLSKEAATEVQGPEAEAPSAQTKAHENKVESSKHQISESPEVALVKNSEISPKSTKNSNKSAGKELNDTKLVEHSSAEVKELLATSTPTKPALGKGSDSANQKNTADVFDFKEEEEEVLDKIKPRHNTERENCQKSKKSDSTKIPFKWDINDITSKDTKPSFESKMTNKMVNHKQESLFASWAKSLAENSDKDQSISVSNESTSNKLNKKSNAFKKQPKVSLDEKTDADKDVLQPQSAVQSVLHDRIKAHANESKIAAENVPVGECAKEIQDTSEKLDEVNIKIAVSTIQDLQNEEKRERESDVFADEGTLVIDETNSCITDAITERPADQEPPPADSETALAIQSILGLEAEDATNKIPDYPEAETLVDSSVSDNQPAEEKIVPQDLLEEPHTEQSEITSVINQEPLPSQVLPPPENYCPNVIEQVPGTQIPMPTKEHIDTVAVPNFEDQRQKVAKGKRQKQMKAFSQSSAGYGQVVSEDYLQDTQSKEDSDDGALHIATDVLPVSPREEQPNIAHQILETREEPITQEFEVPNVKKAKSRRKTSGKGMEESNLLPEQKPPPSVFDLPVSAPAPIRQEPEPDLDAGVDLTGFGSPPLASNKGEDRDISMSDYTDSERNDDNEFGGEESKRPQRGGGRRKNYKKMSGISPRTNSPRSRTSPRSPRVASPKQLSPKSDIASPVVKIERLPLANKSLKLDDEPAPKDIQTSPAPSTAVKENISVKDVGMRRGRSSGSAVELTQKTLNVYDFDEVESEEQNAPIPKRRSSSRKKKSIEETFDSKDSGKVLKSEIMETGIKMTIRPTVRQSKETVKEKGNDFPRMNEIQVAQADPVQREIPAYPVEEKKAMKPRDIMSAEHRTRALLAAKEIPKAPPVSEQPTLVPLQSTPSLMSNIDRIIDDVSKGYFDTGDKAELPLPPQVNHFTTPLTVEVGAYERKRTSSRGSCAEESMLKSPSMKSPSLKSPQIPGAGPAFHLVKSPANTISPVNPLYQNRMSTIMPNTAYPGHMPDLQNRDPLSLHMMPTPTASSSPISTQSSVIGTMANKLDMHVTMTVPQLTSNNGRIPAHMSCTISNPVVTEKEIGMNLTKSANESFPTTVLNTVSSTGVGRSVIANAHTHLTQNANKHLTSLDMSAQHPEASNPAVKPNMPIVNAPKKPNVPPHLPSRNAPISDKSNIPVTVALSERQQQSVSSAPTCVVHPITTTSLSRQPPNMPTMIQPPSSEERFLSQMKMREDMTKDQLQHIQYLQLVHEMQQQQQAAAKLNKTCQKQQDMSKEHIQRPPSAHSNQQRLVHEQQQQAQQAFLAMHPDIQFLQQHSKQSFFQSRFWSHPHLHPPGLKIDDKKQEGKTSSPSLSQQQHNVIAASSQHPQIKSPALAQTAPNIHQIGLSSNTSPPNSVNKKALEKTNTTLRWGGGDMVVSAHEGTKTQLPSHEAPRASPREHWAQPGMHSQLGPKPAHQQSEINPPMSQKEHIKKKRAEERKQQELEELRFQRQRELQIKQLQLEQAAHRKPGGSTSNQPTDMRQTAHVPGQQRPDGQLENKALMEAHFVQHPLYPGMSDMRRPPSHNPSAFTPPISGSDISQAMPAHKNYAEIQQQYQQHPHLYNVPIDLLAPRLPSHYLPRPGLPIQDLTDAGPAGRSRSPPHIQNNPGTPQTSKHREQGEQLARMQHENPLHMPPRAIQEGPAPGGEGSLLSLLQRYPVMWQGVLALKNDQCVVQLHMINGFEQLVKLSLPQQGPDGSVQPLRIAQRMRLEAAQLDGVIKRMKFDNDYCMLLALPCGRDHDHIIEQTRAMTTGFIQYLQQKQAAGIVNVAEPETQQPAYVVHIFPPCDFSRTTLERLGFGLMQPLRDLAHLLVIITTVA